MYRPPRAIKKWIEEFRHPGHSPSEWIVGDFNIHVRCPSAPLARDLLNVIERFSLVQYVTAPTHEHGHMLDFVLSHGFTWVLLVWFCTYRITYLFLIYRTQLLDICPLQQIRDSTDSLYCASYISLYQSYSQSGIDELAACFNSACTSVLDTFTPMKENRPNPHSQPWSNDQSTKTNIEMGWV